MRRLLLAFIIVLLPLRSWIGDAMAMELTGRALQPTAAQALPAPAAAHGSADMHAECPDHPQRMAPHPGAGDAASGAVAHDGADCATCAVCQICHGAALTPQTLSLAAPAVPTGRPQPTEHGFASAERAPGFKPPIF